MRFYRATTFLFPNSLRMRMFTVCFIGTHLPLLTFAAWQFTTGAIDWPGLAVLLGATLVGTVFTLLAIDGLLAPVRAATAAVATLERDQMAALKAVQSGDMLGALIAGVDRAAEATRARVATLDSVAHRDPLTDLWNRRGFLTQTSAVGGGALAILDLDRFKQINDLHGHAAGDEVLRDFATFLRRCVRRDDIVGRWGGEEFAVLFPGAGEHEAATILHRMSRRLAAGAVEGPDETPVSFSGGVVDLVDDSVEQAMTRADAALYAAKRGGRDQVRVGAAHERVG
ncbi:GGDEF domain-containing protein [Sphingomonas sp. LT1P40]|uniref:GGDEF domain-containing protein n=1 Tax=Alteristakelama amylovorans TaxID=3096166 RepID=UPI002FC85024